ncbi:4-hydroxy-tetrahydrodipicolinate synthase [Cohnella fermenti]|uniref:4-hydroxy-tetrahydrodipicolinate synthase n=1 Tax=Cohnella fermenti TaxID=2565925 RepID=A0A4S4BWQ6_9BACL|nr:4-hydroxy-tetrahydrodipicolinate synthase [Cohnella fermenti]THF79598.1 4-hydroxy-tetrahydrodipicolinate synthase [Cohnella fermenti]
MLNERPLGGLYVPVVAPFGPDGELDIASYRRYIGRLAEEGIQGLVVNGTTGESPTVSWEEVRLLIEATREIVGERELPILVGTGTNDTRATVRRTEEAMRFGADGALVVVPYYSRPSQEGIVEHFRQAAATGLPVVAYEIPARTGVRLTPEAALAILSMDGVIGMKDSSGDLTLLRELLRRGNRKPVLCGEDALLPEMLLAGAAGGFLASANAHTARFLDVLRLFREGRAAEGAARFEELQACIRLLFREPNPAPLKWLLARSGAISCERTRLPLVGITDSLKRELEPYIPAASLA